MQDEITIRIAGQAGQGMQTVGMALCKMFKDCGYNIFANQDYMSRIRGGNNFFQLRISERPIYTLRNKSDVTAALDKPSVDIHKKDLNTDGVLVLDKKKFNISEEDDSFFNVPLYDMAKNTGGSDIFINSVSCGVLASMTGVSFTYVERIIRFTFSDKTSDVIEKNISAARAGYDFTKDNFKRDIFKIKKCTLTAANAPGMPGDSTSAVLVPTHVGTSVDPKDRTLTENLIMNGNDAIALGAIKAGCKFYSAYPMTPSTSIMNVIAHYAKDFNIVVEQGEDEIGVVNMVIGASFTGVRSMAATSGGGFCLMVEGISLSGMTETPIVLVDAQRPAPATGFPTRTEQADLEFVLHAGHGEFARAVYTPGTIEEAFYLVQRAFNIAEKYQIPVFIMTDQHLADSYRNIEMFSMDKIKVQRFIISKEESGNIKDYKRYLLTESGISPRAIPGWIEDVIYADSDEHTEEGHITESGDIRNQMVEKRFYKKMAGLLKEVEKPTAYNLLDADVILVGFGSTYGVMKEVSEVGRDKKVGFIHLSQVWPFPAADFTDFVKGCKKIITVENNAGAQLARLIRRETGIHIAESILKYDGRPFDLDYLMEKITTKDTK